MTVSRSDIEEVMQGLELDEVDTVAERNAARREAVETYLEGIDDTVFREQSVKAMILSDLSSYSSWEQE